MGQAIERPRRPDNRDEIRRLPLDRRSFTTHPWQIATVAFVALFFGLVLADAFFIVAKPLALLFIAIVIAEALSPIVVYLEHWMSRGVATVVVYLTLLVIIVALGFVVVPPLIQQAQQFIMDEPSVIERTRNFLDQWEVPGSDRLVPLIESRINRIGATVAGLPATIVTVAIEIVLVFFMSLYWLLAVRPLKRFVLSLVPEERRDYAAETFREIGQMMGGYVRGAAIQAIVIGTLTYIGLTLIGLQFVIVLAVLAGVMEFIPVVGPLIASVPIIGFGFANGLTTGIIVTVFWLAIQQFENHILTPIVMKSQTDITPLLIIFAIFVGGEIAGVVGALVAIPLAGAIKVITVRVIGPWVRNWAGVENPGIDEPVEESG